MQYAVLNKTQINLFLGNKGSSQGSRSSSYMTSAKFIRSKICIFFFCRSKKKYSLFNQSIDFLQKCVKHELFQRKKKNTVPLVRGRIISHFFFDYLLQSLVYKAELLSKFCVWDKFTKFGL